MIADTESSVAGRHALNLFAVAVLLLLVGCSSPTKPGLTSDLPQLHSAQTLQVSSHSFQADTPISRLYSAYGENAKPEIEWQVLPAALSYTLVVEDPDAHGSSPFVHWIVWNIPQVNGTKVQFTGTESGATFEGTNGSGTIGYYGPHPPIGDEPHHYHFEVFALNTRLAIAEGANREAVVAAMAGHVVGSGEIVGSYVER